MDSIDVSSPRDAAYLQSPDEPSASRLENQESSRTKSMLRRTIGNRANCDFNLVWRSCTALRGGGRDRPDDRHQDQAATVKAKRRGRAGAASTEFNASRLFSPYRRIGSRNYSPHTR